MTDTETTVVSDTCSFTTAISDQEEVSLEEEEQSESREDKLVSNKRAATEELDGVKEPKRKATNEISSSVGIKQDQGISKPSCTGVDGEISNQADTERKESSCSINSDQQKTATATTKAATIVEDVTASQGPLISISSANGQSSNPLSLLSEQQHQQLLQTFAQASGQDLASLTASSLAQAMVSPIAVPGLTHNLLQHLQGGSVITTLPGPPPPPLSQQQQQQQQQQLLQPAAISQEQRQQNMVMSDDSQAAKRGSATATRSLSNDERRQRRLLRNRVAAKECRKKKKLYIHDMEEKIQRLEEENSRMRKQVEELTVKLSMGDIHNTESYRLMKEVEELNAKLGMGHMSTGNSNNTSSSSALTTAIMAVAHQQQLHQLQPLQPLQSQLPPPQPQSQSQSQSQPQPQSKPKLKSKPRKSQQQPPPRIIPQPPGITEHEQNRSEEKRADDVKLLELESQLKVTQDTELK
ncbi:hypothetical protein DFQ28_002673 [Apophysomyces sp. BC1034]|nr:hypothetical protein DFQ30_005063 [Apophysomyces sp. BC1015]KAG0179635.1 hypothetical protein DFQ29_001863 [Apophysomyces sp. BC1021]KAG0189975.1 hypothetical protein DFQ28_002673 [Apophysomyces sp. BC1034]